MTICLLRKSNLRLIVFILIPLYFVSLAGVFHFEKEKQRNDAASSILEVGHLNMDDQLSFFKQTTKNKQQQQQQQRNNNYININDSTTSTSTSTGRHVLMNNNHHQHDTKPHAMELREKASIIIVGNNIVPDGELDIVLRRNNNDDNDNDNDNDNDDGMRNKRRKDNDTTTTTTKIVVNHHQQGRRRKREKLQIKLDRIAYENYTPNDNIPLWELSDYIPPWMKDYFDWHTEKRRTITPEDISILSSLRNSNRNNNSTSTRFLIVQCVQSNQDTNNDCGSISERLLILPYLLRLAYATKRLLFIHWDVPVDITYFLVPPIMGCDFRVPMWLRKILEDKNQGVLIDNQSALFSDDFQKNYSKEPLVRIRLKYTTDFAEQYNNARIISSDSNTNNEEEEEEEATFDEVFHDIWRIFFVPSFHIRKGFIAAFKSNDRMVAGEYTSIDLSKWNNNIRQQNHRSNEIQQQNNNNNNNNNNNITLWQEEEMIANDTFECASKLQSKGPFFVVTDNMNLTVAIQKIGESKGIKVYASYKHTFRRNKKPKEKELLPQTIIDLDTDDVDDSPNSFYDIFINLYIMSMGHCVVTYHDNNQEGGFSQLATLIGYRSDCYVDALSISEEPRVCEFNNSGEFPTSMSTFSTEVKPRTIEHHFSDPMLGDGADYIMIQPPPPPPQQQDDKNNNRNASTSINNKKKEKVLPQWMEEYIDWHRSTKSGITSSNWNSTKYLILSCFESYKHCGGISDRLKPLPMIVWEAYQSQRLLLIWWDKPKPLEEWLVPPNDDTIYGVDWTVPVFLKEALKREQPQLIVNKGRYTAVSWKNAKELRRGGHGYIAIAYCIQSPDAGEALYINEQILLHGNHSAGSSTIGNSYQDVFHHLFRRFFTPTPRLANLIQTKMNNHNLIPGRYSAVHLRAMYGRRDHREYQEIVDLAVLGVNCASNLYPGAPIFFASDTSFAVDSAHAYGRLHNLPIVSLDYNILTENNNDTNISDEQQQHQQQHNNNNNNPIHLDKDPNWRNRSASEYDSTFVDLYMLAESRCVAYSNGGYGTFGSLLSYDSDCKMRFFRGSHKVKKCIYMTANRERHNLTIPNATNDILLRST